PRWNSTSRVARPRKSGRTPLANGSRVPPWPIRRVAARRRTRATTSCDVGPTGLATTRIPSRPPDLREPLTRSAIDGCGEPARLGDHGLLRRRQREVDRGPGGAGVPTAAEATGEDRRVDASRSRPDAHPGGAVRLLEEDGDLGPLRLGQE